jgi:hypothetical protein
VAFSMAWRAESGEQAGGGSGARLASFRREMYRCAWRRADALFELGDALLAAGRAAPLPYLSEEPAFRRSYGMIYQGLAGGRIDEDTLRDLLVRYRPADWPCVFGIDASTIGRPRAVTSPGREFHHHSCAGHTGTGDPVIKGWAWQWLSQLSFDADSWTAPQDAIQVGREDAGAATAAQIIAHAARLRAHGETRIPLYVMDAGYDEAPVTWDLRDHLDRVQILVRVRNDRVMYRDPAPGPPRPGRPRRHGEDRFECADPATWGEPDQVIIRDDDRYGLMTVMSWAGLHPKLACRGRFETMARPPIIGCHLIRVTVEHLPGGRIVPGPLWLWWAGPGQPDLGLCARGYLHRFDLEHTYRFAKTALGWHKAALRTPAQFGRWTWIVLGAITQLRLARALAEDHRHAWERRRRPGRLTPGRVRRDFARLAATTGTPASPPKPSRAGPGRPKGRTSTPATRHDVIKKAA